MKLEWQVVDNSAGERTIVSSGATAPGDKDSLRHALDALIKLHHPTAARVDITAPDRELAIIRLTPDTANHFLVGAQGDNYVILKLAGVDGAGDMARNGITRARALNLAAWLVALADEDGEFDRVLAAVKAT